MMMTSFRVRRPDDWHVHLREGEMLRMVAPYTAKRFGRALVMPNTTVPVTTAEQALAYKREIERVCSEINRVCGTDFRPVMTLKLLKNTSVEVVSAAGAAGVKAIKLYPDGATTNSDTGITCPLLVSDPAIYREMEKSGVVLSVHAEDPSVFVMDREAAYLPHVGDLLREFPRLKVVLEHVTSAEAVEFVRGQGDNVAATITAHHLAMTLDDVVGGMLAPHSFCKPVAKRPEDREAVRKAAFSGSPKFFFGSDSAPHLRGKKECASGCAGCFTAPFALELLATIAAGCGGLGALEKFASESGARFYGLEPNSGSVELSKRSWAVPAAYGREGGETLVVPFMAGQTLDWYVTAEG